MNAPNASAAAAGQPRDPLLKDAALRMLCIASKEVRQSKAYVGSLEALLELQGSRLRARYDAAGDPVLLEAQDRRR